MTRINKLVCGSVLNAAEPHNIFDIMSNIDQKIRVFQRECWRYLKVSSLRQSDSYFAPFCARALLELSFIALAGRIDAFRLLTVQKFQDGSHELFVQLSSRLDFSKDILPRDEPQKAQMWDKNITPDKINRAVLSSYMATVIWGPAHLALLDSVGPVHSSPTLDALKAVEPDKYLERTRGEIRQLYSTLSKGVHNEFLLPQETVFDVETIQQTISNTIKLVAIVSLLSHFAPTISHRLSKKAALELFMKIDEAIHV